VGHNLSRKTPMEIAEVLEGHWKVSDEVQHSEDVDLI